MSIREGRRVFAENHRIWRIDLVDEAVSAFGERRVLCIRLAVERDERRRIVREHAILAHKPFCRIVRPGDLRVVKSAGQQLRPRVCTLARMCLEVVHLRIVRIVDAHPLARIQHRAELLLIARVAHPVAACRTAYEVVDALADAGEDAGLVSGLFEV